MYYPSRRQSLASLRALIDFLRTKLKARTGSAESKQRMILGRQPTKEQMTTIPSSVLARVDKAIE
jgi:hypothetical protein